MSALSLALPQQAPNGEHRDGNEHEHAEAHRRERSELLDSGFVYHANLANLVNRALEAPIHRFGRKADRPMAAGAR